MRKMTKYVRFIGDHELLYKVIREKSLYVLVYCPEYYGYIWERKEYIDKVYELYE